MTSAQRILAWMAQHGHSAARLAQRVGVAESTVHYWTQVGPRGAPVEPTGPRRERLREVGVPLDALGVDPPLTEVVLGYVERAPGAWSVSALADELDEDPAKVYSAVRALRRRHALSPPDPEQRPTRERPVMLWPGAQSAKRPA